jgi:hypothetical protein
MAYRSIRTVRADVARRWFQAEGEGIVWAIVDSRVDGNHPHFRRHAYLELFSPLQHRDFTADSGEGTPLADELGTGTHSAAVISGEMLGTDGPMIAFERVQDIDGGGETFYPKPLASIAGMAPKVKLLSLKILGATGSGTMSLVLLALDHIQQLNQYGRRLLVHGVNLGLGYDWDPRWYACGESPVCIEVNRLVQSGVVVVAAAGNSGYGYQNIEYGTMRQGYGLSINDPGNSELAITVGSTHRDQPLTYGVSYFSSKGPTLDGRSKPDLVAPGEHIVSALSGSRATGMDGTKGIDFSTYQEDTAYYIDDSGTSMATAHVSGIVAALLSVRRELIGKPSEVKSLLMSSAASLGRDRSLQGAGLADLLAALFPAMATQAVSRKDEVSSQSSPGAAPGVLPPQQFAAVQLPAQTAAEPRPGIRMMISYACEDEKYKTMLMAHLSALTRSGRLDVWQDREIPPGKEYRPEIFKQIDDAHIIVLLVSADFLASDFAYKEELGRAIERHKRGTARVIPVIVRDVEWKDTPFRSLNALPKDGLAVKLGEDIDQAWRNVVTGIRTAVEELESEQQSRSAPRR